MEKHYEDIIYHYCSVESFFNIITSKVLWLSDIEYMNDRLEGQWSNEIFKNLDIQANAIVSSDIITPPPNTTNSSGISNTGMLEEIPYLLFIIHD